MAVASVLASTLTPARAAPAGVDIATGPPALAPRGDATRDALVAAALDVFAHKGFHAVSTREIAQAAGVNQALIGYHFRNKEGLYVAVFEHITAQIRARIDPLAHDIEALLTAPAVAGSLARRRNAYLPVILRLTDGMADLLTQDRSAPWAQLILREQQAPTAAFAVIYDGFMSRVLSLLTRLLERIFGPGQNASARITVITIFGQVMAFRAARAAVMRQMGWERVGPAELGQIQQQVRANVTAMLSAAPAAHADKAPTPKAANGTKGANAMKATQPAPATRRGDRRRATSKGS